MMLRWDESGVSWDSSSGEVVHLAWEQVDAVFAFKQDCWTVDQIRLMIGSTVAGWMEATEDDAGFAELVEALPQRLPGCAPPEVWFQRVAFPSMETRWTEIYRRADSSGVSRPE